MEANVLVFGVEVGGRYEGGGEGGEGGVLRGVWFDGGVGGESFGDGLETADDVVL